MNFFILRNITKHWSYYQANGYDYIIKGIDHPNCESLKQATQETSKGFHPTMKTLLLPLIFALLASAKQLLRCKACEKLAEQVQKRMDETGKRGGQVAVGHRFGPNGESVHKKVIDYAVSYFKNLLLAYPRPFL